MKKDNKNGLPVRTICTRSLASASTEQETPRLRRSSRGTPSTPTKLITPTSSTRKSERLASSPASVTKKSGIMEKKNTASPLRRSNRGKNVSSENSKGSDKSGRTADTSSDIEESKHKIVMNREELANKIKKREPKMTSRSYKALFREALKKQTNASSNDEEVVAVRCSCRVPAGIDNARDDSSSPHANSESKSLPVGNTSLEKCTYFPVKLISDTEMMVHDASPMVETGDDSVIGSPSESLETQKLIVSQTSLETDIDLPLKRKRDTAGIVLDACAIVANAYDYVMSSDGVIPSPSGCKNNSQLEMCSTCEQRQKAKANNVNFENLSVCSCIAQAVQESDHVAQVMNESGSTTSRDYGENRQNMQQHISYDPKLSSLYPEYWVPAQLSDVQLEQYCQIIFSKYLSLSSLSKNDLVGALNETLTSVRKTCDHPYVMNASLKSLLTKNLELHEVLDVEVKASGKLYLLDAMLTQIKTNGLKAVVFYQTTQSPEGLLLANILEDFVSQRFGQDSYEHGVSFSKKNAINNFNKKSQCFVLLLERRACSQSIKLLRAENFIFFGSSLNPSHDVKLLEKIKIESHSERTKLFRLYSTFTVEEKALILARKNNPIENLNRPLTHTLLMWGASYLFDKLDHFHGKYSGVPFERSIKDKVIHEFSSIISSKVREENEGKLCLLLEVRHVQGTYSSDLTLFGEEHVKLSDEDSPNIFWTKLLGGKNPMWKYHSDTPQRSRKRARNLQGSEEAANIGNDENIKKLKKASDDVIVDNDERKASGNDHMGALESPKVIALDSSRRSASVTNSTLNGNDSFELYFMGGHISEIPEDMLAGIDWRQIQCESQRNLHADLKPEMAKLSQVLHLSEDSTSMVESFLEYVIENHRVCKEPASTLQAFQIALSWIAALLADQKLNRKESVVLAKSELAFKCGIQEVDYIYSMLYCMKSIFLERTQGATVRQKENDTKLTCSSATKDIEKALSYIKKKCKNRLQNCKEKHEEKKFELSNMYEDKKQKLENEKEVESAIIRIQCRWTSTRSLEEDLKLLDHDHEIKIDKITSERDESLKSLEQMHEAEKKKLAEDEEYWISRVKKWAQAELINCAPEPPIKSDRYKVFSGICSSNTSKNAPDVQICNDANGEATYADMNCMVSKKIQVPEAEKTLRTIPGSNTQQVHEMVALRNNKAMDVSTLSSEQPQDIVVTKCQSNEHVSITVPEILVPTGCQEEFAALNVQLSEYQISDIITSVTPNQDVPSRVAEISKSFVNLAKSASPEFSLNREEALVTVENNRTSHVGSDSDNILDKQNEEACSLDKEIPDDLGLNMAHPASAVETRGSTEDDQILTGPDDQDMCPMPASPAGQQPDPATNIQGQNREAEIEPQPGGSPMPSSSAGQQSDPATNIQGQNIEAAIELQPGSSTTVQTGVSAGLEQGDQVACPLPTSPAGNQLDSVASIEDQSINTSAEPHIAGLGVVEIDDSAVSDQVLVTSTKDQNITTVAQLHTAGSNAVETGGSLVSDQDAQDASPLPFSGNHPDAAVNIEEPNNTTVAEPHTSDPCEMEIAEPDPQVEQTIFSNYAVIEDSAEPSSTVSVPSRQNAVPPVSQIPFPVFNNPFQHELEKLRRESENKKKIYQEKKSTMKTEFERKIAELQAEYQRNYDEVKAKHTARTRERQKNMNIVLMNKFLAVAFMSKCINKNTSQPSPTPRGRVQQLAQVYAQRNHTATAPLQPPASSAHCPMPQSRQPLISSTAPSLSSSPVTNPTSSLPQTLTYQTVLIQQEQEQQHNLNSGLQSNNDVVYLSDDD